MSLTMLLARFDHMFNRAARAFLTPLVRMLLLPAVVVYCVETQKQANGAPTFFENLVIPPMDEAALEALQAGSESLLAAPAV